jgi:hypothetical protein
LQPNSEFLRYFNNASGSPKPVAPTAPAQWILTGQIWSMHLPSC